MLCVSLWPLCIESAFQNKQNKWWISRQWQEHIIFSIFLFLGVLEGNFVEFWGTHKRFYSSTCLRNKSLWVMSRLLRPSVGADIAHYIHWQPYRVKVHCYSTSRPSRPCARLNFWVSYDHEKLSPWGRDLSLPHLCCHLNCTVLLEALG